MVTTHYHWDADDNVFEELDDQKQVTCTYTHAPGQYGELLSENRGGTVRHYHSDAQGSTTELTDDSGTITDTFTYSAFGEQLSRTGTTETPYRWNGAWGYQYDEGLESYYVRARVYEPTIARWISVDPLWPAKERSPFGYAGNSPAGASDPSGLHVTIITNVDSVGGAGHAGIIVGNDAIGYTYFSWQGEPQGTTAAMLGLVWSPCGFQGTLVTGHFENWAEAIQYAYVEGYDQYFGYNTTHLEDVSALQEGWTWQDYTYNIFWRNCGDAAHSVSSAAGRCPNECWMPTYTDLANQNCADYSGSINSLMITPQGNWVY